MKSDPMTLTLILTLSLNLIFTLDVVHAQPADSAWPQFHGILGNQGRSPYDTSETDGAVLWTFQADAAIESSPVIAADGTIYFGCHDGFLYAIDSDGNEKWKFDAGPPVYDERWGVTKSIMATPAIAADGTVYVYSSANYMFAVNPDGTEKWKVKIKWDNDFWSSPMIAADGTVYIGSGRAEDLPGFKGGLFALNPDGSEKWFFDTGNGITMPVNIADDGTLYLGIGIPSQNKVEADTGEIIALTSQGKKKWGFPVKLWVEGPVGIGADGTIYATTKEGDLYALKPDGTEKWRFHTNDGLSAAPTVADDGTIYLGAWDNHLYALKPDGTEKWRFPTPAAFEGITSPPAVGADGTIYIGSNSGMFYALNPDGTEKWSFDESVGSGISAGPAIREDGTVIIASQSGKVYALGCCREDGGEEGMNCESKEYEHSIRVYDAIECPATNVCVRGHKDGVQCYEYGSCTEGYLCNIVMVNDDDEVGQFILKSKAEYHIHNLEPGSGVSISYADNEPCEEYEIVIPTKMVCEGVGTDDGTGSIVEGIKETMTTDCGDGVCEGTETCDSCHVDCGRCAQETADVYTTTCGDGTCDPGEEGICQDDCGKGEGFPYAIIAAAVIMAAGGVAFFVLKSRQKK